MLVRDLRIGVLADRKLDKKKGQIVDLQIQNPICGFLHAKPNIFHRTVIRLLRIPYEPAALRFHAQRINVCWEAFEEPGKRIIFDMEEFLTNFTVHPL